MLQVFYFYSDKKYIVINMFDGSVGTQKVFVSQIFRCNVDGRDEDSIVGDVSTKELVGLEHPKDLCWFSPLICYGRR